MSITIPDLDPAFSPDSVAVVGASPDSFYAGNLVDNLLDYGFDGSLYPVNPKRDTVWGRTCYDAVDDVPETVDLVVVSVPRDYVVEVVRAAGQRGVPAALVISAGFSEADEHGAALEADLADAAAEVGIRVIGPNCIGLMSSRGATLTSTCSREPQPGSVALVSQSGALAFTTFFERAADEDIHFSHIVSTGNEADLTTADYVAYLAEQETVDVICTYLEGVTDPDRFVRAAENSMRNGTPVLSVKIGQSDVAEAATLSHTGSLTGNDEAWEAVFDQTGVQRVPDVPDLLSRSAAHATYDTPDGDSVAIASTSGGLASLLADMAAERKIDLPDIAGETERTLLEMEELLTFGEFHNPADIRGYGSEVLPKIAETLFADGDFDAYVFAIGLSAVDDRAATIAADLESIAESSADPVFVLWTGRKVPDDPAEMPPYAELRETIPVYEDPGRCMDAVASTIRFRADAERLTKRPTRTELEGRLDASEVDLPRDRVLPWTESETLLSAFDVPVIETQLATDADEAAVAAEELGFPVVLKIDSPALPHRTDVGAVKVGIDSTDAARAAFDEIVAASREHVDPDAIEGVLVQPMVDDGVEAILGIAPDDVFGSLVTVGPGGVLVESLDDAELLVPPFSKAEATEAIEATVLDDLLEHRRDGPALEIADLADLLVSVGDLAATVDRIAEIDLNPAIVTEDGPIAVDALIKTE